MTANAIRQLLEETPFLPFVIHMPDRPSMRVPHADFAHISPKGKTMIVYAPDGEGASIIDIALITQLEPRKESARKRRR